MKLESNVAYRCKTEAIAMAFLKQAEEKNWRWRSGFKATIRTNFMYEENTCYIYDNKVLIVDDYDYLIKENYTVIDYIPENDNPKLLEGK